MIEEQKARGQEGKQETSLNTLAPCGRGQGEGSKSLHKTLSRICKFAYCSLTNSTLSQRERVKHAFTLAEVLITLGIIGIVAAMTLPSLVQKYKEKQRVTQLKKAYSVLNQAFLMAVNDYGTPDEWGLTVTNTGEVDEEGNAILDYSGSEKIAYILKKYINSKTMEPEETIGYVRSLDGRKAFWPWKVENRTSFIKITDSTILANGWVSSPACVAGVEKDSCGDCWIVIPSKNMKIGVEVFNFRITKKGFVPAGYKGDLVSFYTYCDPKNTSISADGQGRGCAAWVLYNGNMDYLHCHEKLDWDEASSCK
ncbi:type II secretion system protein [bacterium]|nr:type II secretion system protein [bacterium]